ncbi:MAG TPA: hypothetical protein VE642_10400, partial [Pyrinomonadaceae bacterium]|nr:hypothetical protein [Pyrinomonadaceae bacterium]
SATFAFKPGFSNRRQRARDGRAAKLKAECRPLTADHSLIHFPVSLSRALELVKARLVTNLCTRRARAV